MAADLVHEYKRDDKLPVWHGFHAFRSELGSTLYALGADDLMIQQLLRHCEVAVTREQFIKTTSERSVAAMSKLQAAFGALCADRALATVPIKTTMPN